MAGDHDRAGSRPDGPGSGIRAGAAARLVTVLVLLVLAALGTGAREVTRLSATGMLASSRLTVLLLGSAELVAMCLVVAGLLWVLFRRRDDGLPAAPAKPRSLWARMLVQLTVVALIVLVISVLRRRHRGRGAILVNPLGGLSRGLSRGAGAVSALGTADKAAMVLIAAVVLAAIAAMVLWRRWRQRSGVVRRGPRAQAPPLAAALAAGESALRAVTGVREAIIACYVAMEQALGAAGATRGSADTPGELLDRAVRDGVIATPAAWRLTALFREARFSQHELPESRREQAQQDLISIREDLAARS